MTIPYQMIDSVESFRAMLVRLEGESVLALDTEFVWDRTYYARLGLIQIGLSDGASYLIDPLAIADLTPLGKFLEDPCKTKILHDAPQDLMILRRATGASAHNVFDTRLAAGFAGLLSTLSLGNLLSEVLDVHLAKAHTRADWMARPLAPEELEYAADDVRYLPKVSTLLRSRAREAGVEAWLNEELATLDGSDVYEEKDFRDAYLRIRAAASLAPRNLAVLREIAAWREEEARATDRPRRWLVEDGELVSIATELPSLESELRLSSQTVQPYGDALLAAVRRAQELSDREWPAPVFQPSRDPAFRKSVDAALEQIAARATERKIDPQLVCSRNELARCLQEGASAKSEDHALLRGWRAEFMRGLL